MAKNLFIRPGYWVRTKDSVKGALDLRKFIREILYETNVPQSDACCPGLSAGQPVRINAGTGAMETYNGTAWVAVTSFTPGS